MEKGQCVIGVEDYGENDQARFSIVTGLWPWNTLLNNFAVADLYT